MYWYLWFMMRCAIYTRVSTADQTTENQLQQLREYASRKQWTVTAEYTETVSGAANRRPELARAIADADAGAYDLLLFWRLDRVTRRGPLDALQLLERLSYAGIEYESMQEPYIRSAGTMGAAIIALLASIAECERTANRERTLAGLARARKQGKTLGRPRVVADRTHILQLRSKGLSIATIATRLGLSRPTVWRRIKEAQ